MATNTIMCQESALEEGWPIIKLYPMRHGRCTCRKGDECPSPGKHPRTNKWQEAESADPADDPYGVRLDKLTVIDVDPRNGGKAIKSIEDSCGYIVRSGGGGWHYYFNKTDIPLAGFRAIYGSGYDIKSGSGAFVVGDGSPHESGFEYEAVKGNPIEVGDFPAELLDAIRDAAKPKVTEIAPMRWLPKWVHDVLKLIDPDEDYHQWISIGMALHHESGGSDYGLEVWDVWSSHGEKYKPGECLSKWHGFSSDGDRRITLGTLKHLGYSKGYIDKNRESDFDVKHIDTVLSDFSACSPPEVDDLVADINAMGRKPRPKLAVGGALQILSNNARGIIYEGSALNIFTVGLALSGTGKDAIFRAVNSVTDRPLPSWKSAKELLDCIAETGGVNHSMDEVGEVFKRLFQKHPPDYLMAICGLMLQGFSSGNSFMTMRYSDAKDMAASLKARAKMLEDIGGDAYDAAIKAYEDFDGKVHKPYVTFFGVSNPDAWDNIITSSENARTGLLGRFIVFREDNPNPRKRKGYTPAQALSDAVRFKLGLMAGAKEVVSGVGVPKYWDWADDFIADWQDTLVDHGLSEVPARVVEIAKRVAGLLALWAEKPVVTMEHAKWSFQLCLSNCMELVKDVYIDDLEKQDDLGNAVRQRVLNAAGKAGGTYRTRLITKMVTKPMYQGKRESIEAIIDQMLESGEIRQEGKKIII